jgi:hypothetical protein
MAFVDGGTSSGESGGGEGDLPVARTAGLRKGISRRVFLYRGSIAAGVGAAVATVPGLGGLLTSTAAEGPEIDTAATSAGSETAAEMSEPIVAHVIDASTGEITLYQGTQQIVARSPAIAQAIARLAAQK